VKRLFQLVLLLASLACCAPAHATITFSQVKGNASCSATTCSVTGFTAIAAGSFIVARASSSGTGITFSSGAASGGGTWVIPSGCTTNSDCHESDTTAKSVMVEYILSSTGSPTSLTVGTASGTIADTAVAVYTFTGSSMAFDVGAVRDQTTSATSFAGTSAGTLTGTNDAILQYGSTNGNFNSCPNSSASPADFTNGDGLCGLINSTNNAAGTWGLSTTGAGALGAIAFKESGGGGAVTLPRLMTMGAGD
jgi:hypothetical protein